LKDPEFRTLLRNFAVEVAIYAILVVIYFLVVLQLLGDPLAALFDDHRTLYAIIALGLILAQAVLLEGVTSLIIRWLGLETLE
jgi:hypothetical protein